MTKHLTVRAFEQLSALSNHVKEKRPNFKFRISFPVEPNKWSLSNPVWALSSNEGSEYNEERNFYNYIYHEEL